MCYMSDTYHYKTVARQHAARDKSIVDVIAKPLGGKVPSPTTRNMITRLHLGSDPNHAIGPRPKWCGL